VVYDTWAKSDSNGTLPRKPLFGAFSIWTKNSIDFGGVAPKDGAMRYSYFSDIRRLICERACRGPGGCTHAPPGQLLRGWAPLPVGGGAERRCCCCCCCCCCRR
jgi:hypothetical protein